MISSKASIIIPAFNEEKSVRNVVESLRSEFPDVEIIVIDDGSNDKTAVFAEKAGARVIRKVENQGYGAALKTGILSSESDYIVTFDADGQMRVEDIHRMWEYTKSNDIVIGARQKLIHSNLWRMPGKWFLGIMAQYLVSKRIPDLNSGLRIINRKILLKYMHLCPNGFSFSTTILLVLLSRGYRVKFVPIAVNKRKGHSTVTLKTGFDAIILILRLSALLNPLRIFLPISFIMFIASLLKGIPIVLAGKGVSTGSLLAFVTGMLFFAIGLLSDQISQMRMEKFESYD